MKPTTLVYGASMSVALVGGVTLYLAGTGTSMSVDRSIYYDQPKHPVTEAMTKRTAQEAQRAAPTFSVKDSEGKPVMIGRSDDGRPQFVYFVLDGCPCSVDAEPLFQALNKHYGGRVEFLAVTDGDLAKAKAWSKKMIMPYPLVPDEKLKIVHGFGVTNSVESLLIDANGTVVKMWPGYSQDLLTNINHTMATTLGESVRPFDVAYAPKKQATGCAFAPANPVN